MSKTQVEPIAIIGMSCRLPQCSTLEDFWKLLEEGRSAYGKAPEHRFLETDYPFKIPESQKNMVAGFIQDRVDEFDATFFGMSPKEAVFLDPQQRILMELVWEALEDAGINPASLRGTLGSVFTGSWGEDYRDLLLRCGLADTYRRVMGNSIGAASARISHLLGLTGPTISTDSACSSTMVAVHMACRHLQLRETNLAIVGGVNLIIKPFDHEDMLGIFSPEGTSKPFDKNADGYGRAEGGGVLVLKRLSEAVADKNKVWGIIRSSAVSQEGLTKSMGTPTVYSESLAMEQAIRNSGLDPSEVTYVEAHGTGTQVGDPIEIEAIGKAYKSEMRKEPLVISSVKGNIGHTESSSGIVGIIKVLLCMKHGKIPKHVGLNKLNPALDLALIPADIPMELKEWKVVPEMRRIAGVSSFGITGTAAHIILEEPMETQSRCAPSRPPRSINLIKLSAKNEESLKLLLSSYEEKVRTENDLLQNLAYSANTGRADFKHRACIVAGNKEEFLACISEGRYLKGEEAPTKTCFLFPGQGCQYPGMAKELYESSTIFKSHFDTCLEILEGKGWLNLKEVLWGSNTSELTKSEYSQLALFLVQYGLIKVWESWGVKPDYCLGHSLGEFAAATCCGIYSLETALELLTLRSKFSSELPPGRMLVVQSNPDKLDKLMWEPLDYAAFNSESQTVISGEPDAVLQFENFCQRKGIKTKLLNATVAYHSRQMEPMLLRYKELLERVTPNVPDIKCKLISSLKGRVLQETEMQLGPDYWAQNLRNPVRFMEASQAAVKEGCNMFIEIGPQPVLSALMLLNNHNANLTCIPSITRRGGDWRSLLTSLGSYYVKGGKINWKEFESPSSKMSVRLPHYPFLRKRYWPDIPLAGHSIASETAEGYHPMLGTASVNPSKVTLFKSYISLGALQYFEDHCIGNRVIFPGAGFLEMTLAAAVQASYSKSQPVTIQDFKIRTALPISHSNFVELQTLVEPSQSNRIKLDIKVYRRKDLEGTSSPKWIQHTAASIDQSSNLTIDEIGKSLKLRSNLDKSSVVKGEEIQYFYRNLENAGLRFGPHFQSLKEAWLADENGYCIFEVTNPQHQGRNYGGSYHVHPIVLDAMLQATMFAVFNGPLNKEQRKEKGVFFVPVKIGKFVWFPGLGSTEAKAFHIHVIPKPTKALDSSNQYTSILLDPTGNVRCLMESVELVETTLRSFEMALARQINTSADLWEKKWVEVDFPKPGNLGGPGRVWFIFNSDKAPFIMNLMKKLESVGKQVSVQSAANSGIFSKGKEVEGVLYCGALNESLKTPAEILEPLLTLTKTVLKSFQNKLPKLVVLTQNALNIDENDDLAGFWRSTVWSFCKSLGNEAMDLKYSCIDIPSKDQPQDATVDAVIHEILSDSRESWVALRNSKMYVPKLRLWRPIPKEQRDLSLPPGTCRFQLALPDSRSIQDLRFRELAEFEMGEFDVEVEVRATALNFKDVLTVLKPSDEFQNLNSLGFDFAGVICKIGKGVTRWRQGDPVFGNTQSGRALPSHVQIHEDHLVQVPEDMTYCEAATLPTVFYTAYYCLVEVAKVKENEPVLIHTASGGVGLVAIQICQSIGATVIATAGSEMKRSYLRSLGVQHVFSSRHTSYLDGILKATEGKGVDIVLNSLTGEGFKEATLDSCAEGARFVEMSKLNIWNGQEVEAIRPDVKYSIVDITYLEHETSKRLARKLDEYLGSGIVKPLPCLRYDAVNIRQALGYLQKAKHVGKIVISTPQFRTTEEGYSEAIPLLFEDRSSYLITGGLGGIGLQVCEWMLAKGARNIVLAGLSPPKEDIAKRIQEMNETFEGAKVVAVQADVANFEECETLIKSKLKKLGLPPLKGIMHAAGAVADGLITNQSWDYLKLPLEAKVDGTINLHELTKDMNLEYFALFSSLASLFGTRGQSVYAAANQFQDGFAYYRRSLGLPATTINWCPWGETGMAVDLEFPGFRPLSNAEGLEILEMALREHRVQTIVMNVDSLSSAQNFVPTLSSYLDEETKRKLGRDREVHKPSLPSAPLINRDLFWQQVDSSETPEIKLDCFKKCVKTVLKQVLKQGENDEIKDDVDFHELGVDSLMFIEIRNGMQTIFGEKITISVAEIQENSSLNKLSMVLLKSVTVNKKEKNS